MKNLASKRRACVAIAAGLLCAGAARAGTIRHDRTEQAYKDRAAEPQFAAVGRYSAGSLVGSMTLIAPGWALTAAHVVDTDADGLVSDENLTNDSVTIGSVTRKVAELIVPVGVNGNRGWNGSINSGFDIALARLESPITTVVPASIYTGFQELGKTVTSVGFGQGGNGKTGATTAYGTKRAGDNVIDRYITFSNGATALQYDFDEPATRTSPNYTGSTTPLDLEYMIGPGDSGGGTFIYENGAWYVAAVHSGTYDIYAYPGATSNASTYGDATLLTRVSAYQDFIMSNIPEIAALAVAPEPASLAALAIVGATLGRRRRKER